MVPRLLVAGLLVLVAGCASHGDSTPPPFVNTDSAPDGHFDASGIPDAVPRVEPRSRYGNPETYVVFGERYRVMKEAKGFRERGTASWYGTKFHGQRTSSGEPYDMYQMTAAHKSVPLPTYMRVTNLRNNRSVIVRVNDRGPFHDGRVIDLSYAAALKLDVVSHGTAPVEIVALDPAEFGAAESVADVPAPEPPPQGAPAVTVTPAVGLFIQLGAFSSSENALGLKGRLESEGIRPVRIETLDTEPLFRVRVGPFEGAALADEVALRLVSLGITDFNIVRE